MSDITDTCPAGALQTLRPELSRLSRTGAGRFDPVRFHYIESMSDRALEHRQSISTIIERKALKALQDYQADFAQARTEAQASVTRISKDYPDSSAAAQRLFDDCDFRAVKRLQARLQRCHKTSVLSALHEELLLKDPDPSDQGEERALTDILRRQERDLVGSLSAFTGGTHSLPCNASVELKSTRRFRELWGKNSTEAMVALALEECPEDSGPLNAQRLVISSLTVMRELSPQYLNRFVSYIDTLQWLETARERANPGAPATNRGKSARQGQGRRKS